MQLLYIDVVLKANENRVLSFIGKGAAKSLTEKHYNIAILILKGHNKPMDCTVCGVLALTLHCAWMYFLSSLA